MPIKIIKLRLIVVTALFIFCVAVWTVPSGNLQATENRYLTVTFLDVGQGDAIFIETLDGVQVLVDGGPNSGVLRNLGKIMRVGDHTINMIVGTHPDKDHIAGLGDVLERYSVTNILTTEKEGKSNAWKNFRQQIAIEKNNGAQVIYARRGQEFQLGASTTLRVLFPDINPIKLDSNTASIVLQVKYGDIEFMLTGDSPKAIEEYLVLAEGEHLESEVLKAGHHGSHTSTSELFLNEVNPKFAVISAGKNNRYGHPHPEVMDMLFNHGVKTVSTADRGDITFLSDGKKVWLK